jgi:hypothetical protein
VGLLQVHCAALKTSSKSAGGGPVTIVIKGGPGQQDITRYYSRSHITGYEGAQKVREKDEIVEFRVSEKVTRIDANKNLITVKAATISKDGTVDLHDLAFPEAGEEIEYTFTRQGEVVRAGDYPLDSVFYIPPVPLPKGPVEIGDTWTMDHGWVGMNSGIPLGVHLVSILKGIQSCGPGRCADIEVSGHVEVAGMTKKGTEFKSTIWGRMIVAVERGTVLWSEIRSREKMTLPDSRTEIQSCMVGALETPKEWSLKVPGKVCELSDGPVAVLPRVM